MKFSGTNVLVTGGSRGIGASIVQVLAGFGLKVWINYRSNESNALALKEELDKKGHNAAIVPFDVSNEDEYKQAIALIRDSDGTLSYLVNNAGVTKDKLSISMKTDEFSEVISSNLRSCFVGCREALKIMSKNRFGSVVNISSLVGERGNAGQVNYSASKGGLIAMTKSFALEAASRGVRFNSVSPGFVQTDMTDALDESIKSVYISNIPLKRFGTPEDIAYAVAFLLSDYSGYITGENIRINGGMYT